MRFGIPTYKRAGKADSILTLSKLGYSREEILVQTQTEDDRAAYQSEYGDVAQIYCKTDAYNCPTNRNNTMEHFEIGENFIMLDDDVKVFCRAEGSGNKSGLAPINERAELDALFDRMFRYARKHDSPIWAWYPVPNAFFMKKGADKKNLLCGTILGIHNTGLKFDPEMHVKEDYEIGLRLINSGHNAVRFNSYTVQARHHSAGGCEDTWSTNEECCRKLLLKYPTLVKRSHREGEVKYVGPR